MRWTWAATFLLAIWVAPRAVLTQAPSLQAQTFDAASVKESSTLELDGFFRTTPGRFTVTNLSVRWILRYAFRLRDYQVVGAPGWTETRYQITATFANPAASDDEVRSMLQRLLADRFQLRSHREQRTLPMYALVKARRDGTFGPSLVPFDLEWGTPTAVPTELTKQTTEGLAALFTAIQEQLGLRLEATRASYDVLVIDSISRPTSD